mgnify:FL=1|jgi:hypothetical protein|tara:strand:+ start:1238 stop:1423 length:186 start_codon:yes stop_codon:yes gene_type:complete
MESIKEVLITRDGMDPTDADDLIAQAQAEFNEHINNNELDLAENICQEWFGLEPDYVIEFF